MEKKVRYLMLLLCLLLFPMKAFALENTIEENTDEVVIEEKINEEDLEEDLIKIINPEEVLLEDNTKQLVGNELEPTEKPTEEKEPVEEDTTKKVENVESDDSGDDTDPVEDDPVMTELEEFTLTGVNTNLFAGQSITFTGASGEEEKYTIIQEAWSIYISGGGEQSITSDPTTNSELQAEGHFLEAFEETMYYNYKVVLQFAEGFTPASFMTATINGEDYEAYRYDYDSETNTVVMETSLYKQAMNPEAVYVDELDLWDVVTDAIAGKAPTYKANTTTEHFTLVGERWEYFTSEELPDGSYNYYLYANASNEELIDKEYEEVFDTFQKDIQYTYLIVLDSDKNIRLNPEAGEDKYYHINLDGESVYAEVYGEVLENGGMRYYIYLGFIITPTEEEIEEPVYEEEPVVVETTYYEEEVTESPVIVLDTKKEDTQDNKLEVRKDKKEKNAKKEEKDTSSNAGLIVFLIILVVIAIAIPISVNRKKQ